MSSDVGRTMVDECLECLQTKLAKFIVVALTELEQQFHYTSDMNAHTITSLTTKNKRLKTH